MATSSHSDNLALLEPGEDPYKPFQRRKSANDAATHRVSPLTKFSNKDELVASVEVGRNNNFYCGFFNKLYCILSYKKEILHANHFAQ